MSDFAVRNLSVLCYADGFTLWHYKAPFEGAGVVSAPGFFNPDRDLLNIGDMILVSSAAGGGIFCVAACSPPGTLMPGETFTPHVLVAKIG